MEKKSDSNTASFLNSATPLSMSMQSYVATSQIVKNKNVLDIGCGQGFLAKRCLDVGAQNVYGIDISADAIQRARKNFGINCMQADINDHEKVMEFAPSLDVLLCNAAQIPLPYPLPNGYFMGTDGRKMMDDALLFTNKYIQKYPKAQLIMTNTNLSNWELTIQICKDMGLMAEVIPNTELTFPIYKELINNEEVLNHFRKVTNTLMEEKAIRGTLLRIYKA